MQPAPELRDLISSWFAAVAGGDAAWLDRHLSPAAGMRVIGTDPEEFLAGQAGGDFLRSEVRAVGGKIDVSVDHVEAFEERGVGWGVALPAIRLPDGKTVRPRWSAVFHREGGDWKLVQLHASIAAGNAETFGAVFPQSPRRA